MPFDISTAKPINGGFDISTAKPVKEEGFNLSTAKKPIKLRDIQTGPHGPLEALKQTYLDIPSAAVRSTILPKELGGKGFIRGATEFETIPTFEETYEKGKKLLPKPLQFLGDLANLHSKSLFGASVPEQADVATSPASWLPLAVGARMPVSATRGITKGGQIVEKGMKGVETGIEKTVTPVGRGVERTGALVSGIEPEVLSATRKLGFRNVIKKENFNKDIPINIADDIEQGFAKAEKFAHTEYSKALNAVPQGKSLNIANTYNKIGKVLKDMGYITEKGNPTGLHLNPALKDSPYTQLFNIHQASRDMARLKPVGLSLTPKQMLKEMKFGEKGNIRELRVNKAQYVQLRNNLQKLWSGATSDLELRKVIDQFYLDGERSGAKGLINAKNLERSFYEAQDTLYKKGLIGERKLRSFKTMTEVEKRQLKEIEKYIGVNFKDNLEKWSLAQEYLPKPNVATFNPFTLFGQAPKISKGIFRGYLRTLGTK